jgi:hypothetical protein
MRVLPDLELHLYPFSKYPHAIPFQTSATASQSFSYQTHPKVLTLGLHQTHGLKHALEIFSLYSLLFDRTALGLFSMACFHRVSVSS